MSEHNPIVAVVDDEASIRKALVRLLRLADLDTVAFDCVADFLASLEEQKVDCVILDLQMPSMTGVELLRRFAELEDAPPVIVVTANDEPRSHTECVALGAKDYLRKPIDRLALMASVRSAIGLADDRGAKLSATGAGR